MEKIKEIFYGLNPINKEIKSIFFGNNNFVQKIYHPPAYIIELLFFNILKCRDFGSFDKIHWHTYFSYKDVVFLLHDYKFGSITIKYLNDNPAKSKIVKELIHKIVTASKLIDKELKLYLEQELLKDNFFLKNSYNELISIYNFYKDKYIKTREILKNSKNTENGSLSSITNILNKRWLIEKESQYYMFSLVISFFSLSEFLLASILCFSEKKISYYKFKELSWSERFLKIFDTRSDKRISQIYENLFKIRKEYRNPLSHGLWSDYEQLLVPFKKCGLIPISYEFIKKSMFFGLNLGISKEKILNTFNNFFDYLNSDSWFKLIIKYLDYSFPIPFNKKEIHIIKKFMKNEEDFEQYLEGRAAYEDAVINREI